MRKITSLCAFLLTFFVGISAMAQVTNVSGLNPDKCYTISTADRGSWYTPSGGTALTSTTKAGVAVNTASTAQQFAFVQDPATARWYLYSVSERKFVAKSGSYTVLSATPTDSITILASSGSTTQPAVVAFKSGTTVYQLGVSNGYNPAVISFYNDLGDAGNRVAITEAGDFDKTDAVAAFTTTVTYNVVSNGTVLKTVTKNTVPNTTISASTMPAGFLNALATHTFPADLTVQANTANTYTVTYAGTTGFPTPADNFAGISTWYFLRMTAAGYYVGSTATDGALPLTVTTTPTGDETYYWGFVGNPYTGITIYNKSTGESQVLASDTPVGSANTGGGTYVTMQTIGAKAIEKFYPALSTSVSGVEGFFLGATDGGNYMNRRSEKLAYWTGGKDAGSTFYVEPTGLADRVVALYGAGMAEAAAAISDTKPFCITQSNYDALKAQYDNVATEPTTQDEYNAFVTAYNAAIQATNAVTPGYYRFVNNAYPTRAIVVDASNKLITTTDAANNLSSVATVSNGATGGKFLLSFNGQQVGNTTQSTQVALTTSGVEYTAQPVGFGYGTFAAGTGQYQLLHDASTSDHKVVGWEAVAAASRWQLEPVESITLALNEVDGTTYATAYLPFGVTIPSGFTAYGVSTDGTVADLGTAVPAGTPFLLTGTATSATLTLNGAAPAVTAANALNGTYAAKTVASGEVLTLGQADGGTEVGFFLFTGTTVPANKAYFNATQLASGVQSVLFGGSITGIDTAATVGASEEAIYDLQGRKVAKAEKGLYIVNGKKVLVK